MSRSKGLSFVVFVVFFIALRATCNAMDLRTSGDLPEVQQQLKEITDRLTKLEATVTTANNNTVEKMESVIKALLPQLVSAMKPYVNNITLEQKHMIRDFSQGSGAFMYELGTKLTLLQVAMSKLKKGLLPVEPNDARCQEGWSFFDNSCYFFSSDSANWTEARQNCQAMDADFPKITNDDQWNYIADMIEDNTWVGLSDLEEEGTFRWVMDGSLETGNNPKWWHEGQPDNHEGTEDCIHYWFFFSRLLWNDNNCKHKMRYVCERTQLPLQTKID